MTRPTDPRIELVERGHEAFRRRDLDALMDSFTDDAVWRLIGGFEAMMGSEFVGREAVRGYFEDWGETLGGSSEIEAVHEAGDHVVAIVRTEAAGAASGAPAAFRWGQVYSFRDGKVSAIDNYYDADEALTAAGLG